MQGKSTRDEGTEGRQEPGRQRIQSQHRTQRHRPPDDLRGPEAEDDDGTTHSIQSLFPSLTIHFTLNSLAVRFFVPKGVDKTELHWMYLGFDDDTEEQTEMRVMQGNLTGAAGLVSLEDGCINEFVQRGTRGSADHRAFIEMGGRDVESSDASRATEVAIRGFWTGYRRIMGFD